MLSDSITNDLVISSQPLIPALYCRVSTGRQENEKTIDSQIDEIITKAVGDGTEIRSDLRFVDNGWPGELLARPALDQLRDAATRGEFNALYVYDLGRLSRSFLDQLILLKELQDLEIKIISLHDINAENDEQVFARNVMGLFHDFERKKIAERMRRGKLFKARSGTLINGQSLYGFNYIKKTDTEPARCEINKEEARVIRMIFDWVGKEGASTREVIKRLYDLGISPRKGKTTFWTHGPIVRLLREESYVSGYIYYNKSEAVVAKKPLKNIKYKKIKRGSRRMRPREDWIPFQVPKIIEDRNLFDKVQRLIEYNKNFASKKRKYDYLLSGIAFCECGAKRVGDGIDKDNFYYRCAERLYRFPLEKKCHSKGINAAVLDKVFWNELLKFINNPSLIRQAAENWLRESGDNDKDRLEKQELTEFIARVDDEEQRYAKAYGAGALDFEKFKELMRGTKRKKDGYQQQLDNLNNKIANQGIDSIQLDEVVEEAGRVFQSLELQDKKQIVRDIITKVIVKGGLEVEVRGRIPLFPSNMGYELKGWNSWVAKCW